MLMRDAPDQMKLGDFVRGFAHDVANPLNAIAMSAEVMRLLLDRGDISGAGVVLERLLSECARCGRLLQGFQRFGAALQTNGAESVAANTLLDVSIDLLRSDMPTSVVMPAIAINGATDTVLHIDRQAMRHAIAALLRNACEAGADKIDIDVSTDAARTRITIQDNGSGIEPRWRDRVTEAFFTTRRAHGAGGLGLTLAREIVQRHAGTLTLHSDDAQGTSVVIELPLHFSADHGAQGYFA